MTLSRKSIRELVRHIIMAILVNLIFAILLMDAFFVDTGPYPAGFFSDDCCRQRVEANLEKRQASGLLFSTDLGSFLVNGKPAPKTETGDRNVTI